MILPLGLLLLSYVLGATPTSYWAGRLVRNMDLRTRGSGNLGATNAFRVLGAKVALPVLIADVAKGWIPVALFPLLAPNAATAWTLAYGAAAVLGHSFSFWVKFRGGKGVATSAGVFLALAPWAALIALVIWLTTLFATRYVSVASLLAAATLPLTVTLTPHTGGSALPGFAVALAAFVIWAHRSNIRRLRQGEEARIGRPRARTP